MFTIEDALLPEDMVPFPSTWAAEHLLPDHNVVGDPIESLGGAHYPGPLSTPAARQAAPKAWKYQSIPAREPQPLRCRVLPGLEPCPRTSWFHPLESRKHHYS
jgi:hypothetical protein